MLRFRGGIQLRIHILLLLLHRILLKGRRFIIAMEGEIIDFYYCGMDLLLRAINMIVCLLDFGVKEFKNKLARKYLQGI